MGMNFDVKKRIWDYTHSEKIDQKEHGFSLGAGVFPFSLVTSLKIRKALAKIMLRGQGY